MYATCTGMPLLSIFFFSHHDPGTGPDRYDFVLSTTRLAEDLGFHAVWLPERHFHPFGGLFPNPAVVAAALATRTQRIGLRAGSVVLPLHHVARVAEEWAVVDALSNGRVGVSAATGWNQGDFVLGTTPFEERREHTYRAVEALQALWRGEELRLPSRGAEVPVRTYPRPVQASLPLWLTATSGPGTFREAARRGLGVLTGYLQQDHQQLSDHIGQYRTGFVPSGSAGAPHVTLMVHACVAETTPAALAQAHPPLLAYQGQFLSLSDRANDPRADEEPLTEDEKQELARYATHKYLTERGLVGDAGVAACRLRELAAMGVDEVACLVDFGLPPDLVTQTLVRLAAVSGLSAPAAVPAGSA